LPFAAGGRRRDPIADFRHGSTDPMATLLFDIVNEGISVAVRRMGSALTVGRFSCEKWPAGLTALSTRKFCM